MSDVLCPCGSEKKFTQCCEPYLLKTKKAPTAESLMSMNCLAIKTVTL